MRAPSTLLSNQVKIKDQECLLVVSKPDQVQLKTEVGVLHIIGARLVLTDLGDGYWSTSNRITMIVRVNLVK